MHGAIDDGDVVGDGGVVELGVGIGGGACGSAVRGLVIIPVQDTADNDEVVDALMLCTAELVVRGAADAADAT